jgi:alkanesulfonate monooxygenase SsuD/methylene tetrahydromethanopterin reductase-like flavin-dependent oxidoreductase (luciferase family)
MTQAIRVGVTFGPTGDWDAVVRASLLAEELGLDAVGFWDHYHSMKPEWALVCGWTAYGYLAARTSRITLTPMVLCRPNHLLGVLAKESSMLQIMSGGRFELGIGAGDYEIEFEAWDVPFADADSRMRLLEESVAALRQVWKGDLVSTTGDEVQLTDAACTPVPDTPPRIVIGAGSSRRLVRQAVRYADEINVYARESIVDFAREQIAASDREIALSVFPDRPDDHLPTDMPEQLARWREKGASRCLLTLGWGDDLDEGVRLLAESARAVNG